MKLRTLFYTLIVVSYLSGCSRSLISNKIDKSQAAQARLRLGLAYLAEGDLKSARQNLERAVKHAPDDYRTQLGMALYAQKTGENTVAEGYYQQALSLSSHNGTVLNNYGAFLCTIGQYELAQQQFTAAVKMPDHGQVADSLENAGYCFLQDNQLNKARTVLNRAVKNDPDKGKILLTEADRLYEQKQYPQARMLLGVYQHVLPASAQSLWLQIRFAALDGSLNNVQRYGQQLAQRFPQSQQYQQFLANEY